MAPENWSLEESRYKDFFCQKNSDIFSMGMVFWELADGKGCLPWGDADIFTIRKNVVEKQLRPSIPPATPADFAKLIEDCWRDAPLHRPSSAEVFLRLQSISSKVMPQHIFLQ